MASHAPPLLDVTEYQFKQHQKSTVFNVTGDLKSDINLLASSSNYGLLFVGDPNKSEFRVIKHGNIIDLCESSEKLLARNVLIPGIPNNIAVSCDGSLLAVSHMIRNTNFLSIFTVQSFLTPNIETKFIIRVHPEDNVNVIQILWNPVISNTLAVILNNGAVGMYNLKEPNYEFYSLDKSEQAKCACWSPKGKQIVIGFPDGKLIQYKPDLKPAKTIACPSVIHEGPFDTIAVQWLSTFQFAVVYLQRGEDMQPSLYILNAPKNAIPTYINYYDICYSGSGPRKAQIFFNHIQPWNILLMASANSVEVAILGTKESGETPKWQQYVTPDEARIELPLTKDKQETFPIGLALDTGCTHQLTIGETQIPVMPMIHVLSTDGMLISFNFLNLTPNAPDICSPPNPISDTSGQFTSIEEILGSGTDREKTPPQSHPVNENKANQPAEISFSISANATSTPDSKGNSIFSGNNAQKSVFSGFGGNQQTEVSFLSSQQQQSNPSQVTTNIFGGQPFGQQKSIFGGGVAVSSFNTPTNTNTNSGPTKSVTAGFGLNLGQTTNQNSSSTIINQSKDGNLLAFGGQSLAQSKTFSFTQQPQEETVNKQLPKPEDTEKLKPLYTIPPTFAPNQQQTFSQSKQSQQQEQHQFQPKSQNGFDSNVANNQQNDLDVNDVIRQMIATQINAFEKELHELSTQSKNLVVSSDEIEETKMYTKKLNDFKELSDRAKDGGIESDVQALRHSLNECFTMVAEVKSKLNMYNNPHLSQLATSSGSYQTNRRQLAKLKQLIATNEMQLNTVNQLIDGQWSNYQDLVRHNSSKRKYMPNLEGIYQTLIRQKDILAQERRKLNYLKSKLGVKGLLDNNLDHRNVDVNSLADSILSMSLSEQVLQDNSYLTDEKLKIIRESVKNRQIIKIRPQRPDRIGLNSEVILETKVKTMKQRDGAATKPEKMEKERVKDEQQRILTKPTPTKAVSNSNNQGLIVQQKQQLKKAQQTVQTQPIIQKTTPTQKVPQQAKEIQFPTVTTTPTFPSAGSPFVKPSEYSSQSTTANIFSGFNLPQQTSVFSIGGNKSMEQQSKGIFNSVTITPQPIGVSEKTKNPPSQPFASLQSTAEKLNFGNGKEPTTSGISFAPKLVENDHSLSYGFMTIQDENKSALELIKDVSTTAPESLTAASKATTTVNKQMPLTTSSNQQTSPFSSLSFGSSSVENNKSPPSTIKFGSVPPKDISQTTTNVTAATQSAPLLSSNSSFETFSLTAKPNDTTKQSELLPTPSSTSTSSESLTSTGTVTESFSFAFTSKAPTTVTSNSPFNFSFGGVQKPSPITATSTTSTTEAKTFVPTGSSFGSSFLGSSTTTAPVATTTATPSSSLFSFASFGTLDLTSSSSSTSNVSSSAVDTTAPTNLSVKSDSSTKEQTTGLENLNICKPIALENTTTTQSSTPSVLSGNLFGAKPLTASESKSAFGTIPATSATIAFGTSAVNTVSSSAPTTTSAGSVFGTTVVPSSQPLFGSVPNVTPATVTSIFGSSTPPVSVAPSFGSTLATTSATSVFGGSAPAATLAASLPTFGASTTTTTSGNIFGGIPKPTQSLFGTTGVAGFGAATTAASPFGVQAPNQAISSASSIFGGGTTATPAFGMQTNAPSAFGSTVVSQPAASPFGSSVSTATPLFGSPKPEVSSTNLFGSASQTSPASGGSLFGASSFGSTGQTTGSIFGGSGSGAQATGFGSGFAAPANSLFGSASPQQQSPFGSTFGQSSFGSPSSFGQTTTGFGSSSPGGTFAQGGPSVAQTGFASPKSFSKPAFGSSPTFGGAPTFGGSPTFGGGATFGTSKPTFGAFGGGTNTGAFSPPSQKNNLFESLGSTDSGISFGNLAHNSNANNTKPQFGGSSFSSWR